MGLKDRFSSKVRSSPVDGVESTTSGAQANPEVELRKFKKQHKWDPFLDIEHLDAVDSALASGNPDKEAAVEETLIEDNSPYAEVRASVPNTDSDEPCSTIRAWVLGAFFCTIVAACNILLGIRSAPIIISSTVVQLIAYPVGCFWAKVVPQKSFSIFGHTLELNPGPFSIKEHTVITIMTAAGSTPSYAIDILLAQEIFYKQYFQWGFQILLIISTQAMGFGLAGITRRFLVWPSSMVWPSTLIFTTVMHSLHDHSASDPTLTNGWSISRYGFFLVVALATFCWEWVPQTMATFLQVFSFPAFIAPKNVLVNQLFGGHSGFGIIPISFDWNTISGFMSSPLQYPTFALLNVLAGLCFVFVAALGLAYAGPEFYRYLPVSANVNYDHFAQPYNVTRILTPDFTINMTAYEEYSPILLGPTFSLTYAISFGGLISTLTHVAVFYGPDVWNRARSTKYEEPDVHLKLMRKYREAPEWWFALVFFVSFAFGMVASQVWPTHLPWWAFIVAILIGSFFFIPVGMIQAITNQQTGLNVITELVVGFMLPGRPVAMMLFKSWGYMMTFNGLNYVSDMKIGHYLKVPPRTMFAAQAFAVIWLSIVQVATYNFLRNNIDGICTEHQAQGLTCPAARTFFNASVIWGVIGPAKVFGAGMIYAWTNWFWLIGFALPVFQYLLAKKYPRSILRYIVFPSIFGAAGQIPPATLYYLLQWVFVGLIFNYWIRRRYFGWWTRYNYALSGALDIGTALCITVASVGIGLGGASFPSWWGNDVDSTTLDYNLAAVTKQFQEGQTPLGPSSW